MEKLDSPVEVIKADNGIRQFTFTSDFSGRELTVTIHYSGEPGAVAALTATLSDGTNAWAEDKATIRAAKEPEVALARFLVARAFEYTEASRLGALKLRREGSWQ